MKNTKSIIGLGVAIAITLLATINVSAMELKSLNSVVTKHESELQRAKADIDILKTELQRTKADTDILKSEHQRIKADIEALNRTVDKLQRS